MFGEQFGNLEAEVVRNAILDTGKRIDGRDTKTVRQIVAEVGILPRAHGSSLFTRGETQALVVATLGTGQDEQIIDALEGEYREAFMMHYNMPPYAVGEVRRMGSPGRREIGHGKLAWRALRPMLPGKDKFPYTIRIVSEITESNGSSSMASVCGGSLSLMDAGVPMERPVAGIAMGLIKEGDRFAVLSDILGDEDHLGDMDFKVAGTDRGITALQMDIKITSINEEIMRVALGQAKDGRLHILGEMAKGLGGARESVSQNAPRITQFTIPKDKIREVIGTGGKVIREITETTGTKIDIEDDGTIKVAAVDAKQGQAAIDWIKGIVAEPEVGVIYTGKVVKTVEFGAFVNFLGARDGLVHISELAPRRVAKVTDVVKEGDQVKVKVLGVDDRGKVRLSMKAVDQETGEDISNKPREEQPAPAGRVSLDRQRKRRPSGPPFLLVDWRHDPPTLSPPVSGQRCWRRAPSPPIWSRRPRRPRGRSIRPAFPPIPTTTSSRCAARRPRHGHGAASAGPCARRLGRAGRAARWSRSGSAMRRASTIIRASPAASGAMRRSRAMARC